MCHLTNARRRSGFKLVELILVMTILVIVSAIAVPRYVGAMSNTRCDAAARRLIADLRLAHTTARQQSKPVIVVFEPMAARYTLMGVKDPIGGNTPYTVVLAEEPYSASIHALELSDNATSVTFDGFGTASAGGTITLTTGGITRTVTLDAGSGRAVGP